MSNLFNAQNNTTRTGNNAVAFKSTLNPVLDLFAIAGSSRGRDLTNEMRDAFRYNAIDTALVMFNAGDIRGGHGERQTFKDFINFLVTYDVGMLLKVLHLIPTYSRWDVVAQLITIPAIKAHVIELVANQLDKDLDSDHPSLLAKWMPSENASSPTSKKLAMLWASALKLSVREYRKMLSTLREKLNLVETQMSQDMWNQIEFEKLPSKAAKKYRKAFKKHAADRYAAYLTEVEQGTKKINAGVLYPYELIRAARAGTETDRTLEAQWKALPNYFETNENVLCVPDVSGSMDDWNFYGHLFTGKNTPQFTPMDVAIALSIYAAERNHGIFKNQLVSFDSAPNFITLNPKDNLQKKSRQIEQKSGGGTNIQRVFDTILQTARTHKLPETDMPTKVFVLSDMQFNSVGGETTNYQSIEKAYATAGYKMPTLIFWRIGGGKVNQPVTKHQENVYLVSGYGPAMFKAALSQTAINPEDLMYEVIYADRYAAVKEALM
jgi:hypothetical protein